MQKYTNTLILDLIPLDSPKLKACTSEVIKFKDAQLYYCGKGKHKPNKAIIYKNEVSY